MTVLSGARLVLPSGVVEQSLSVADGVISAIGSAVGEDLGGGYLLPGFIDLHVHGGGGHDFTSSADDLLAGVCYHQSRGTTRTLASLMAGSLDDMCEQLSWVSSLSRDLDAPVQLVGAHLEGPFLAAHRCGAQNGAHLQLPDRQVMSKLLEAGQGCVRTVTIAPELPGALAVIGDLVEAGVIAALGHTDATYAEAAAGFAAGATLTTHLFNAMSRIDHRSPGAAVAALDSGMPFELINDGVHVHPAMVGLASRCGGANMVLVTDAISATGVGDGPYSLGGLPVEVRDGQARGATGGLAGSTLTMDEAVRRAVLDVGLSLPAAAAAASTNPARVLGLSDICGAIAPGLAADLVLLDDDLRVRRVMVAGRWIS